MPDNLLKFASLFCSAAEGLLASRQEAASVLGVSPNASDDEINSAYKKKVKDVHPDLNPGIDPVKMKMLNAAKDLMLYSSNESFSESGIDSGGDDFSDPDMSYEEIAEMRQEMGRDEFNQKFPGWESELKREMGLDQWNLVFEKYDPNYDPAEDDEWRSGLESMHEDLADSARDSAYDLLSRARDDGKLNLYSSLQDLMDMYPELAKVPEYAKKKGLEKIYQREFDNAFGELFFKDFIDDVKISLQDVLDFPNEDVIKSFLIQHDGLDVEIPDSLLSQDSFGKQLILMLRGGDFDVAKNVIEKYKRNPSLLSGLIKSIFYAHYLAGSEKAINLLMNLPFNDADMPLVKKWLKVK